MPKADLFGAHCHAKNNKHRKKQSSSATVITTATSVTNITPRQ